MFIEILKKSSEEYREITCLEYIFSGDGLARERHIV